MDREINVLALVKGEERFIFLFDDENRDETLRQLARFASNPELDFSWYDAAMLSRKIRDAVPSDDDVPCWVVLLVKFLLDVRRDVL